MTRPSAPSPARGADRSGADRSGADRSAPGADVQDESRSISGSSQFGIKTKLFLAVSCLAALTAIASLVAWYVFGDIGRSVTRVTDESMPGIFGALSLAEKSNEIAVTMPALVTSRSQEERVLEQALLTQRTADLDRLIDGLAGRHVGADAAERLMGLKQALAAKLVELDAAVEGRLDLKAKIETRRQRLASVHAGFLDAIEPLVDDSVFDLVMSGERVTAESTSAVTGLVEGGVAHIDLLLTLNAEINLVAGLLAEALHADERALIEPVRESFEAAAATVERSLSGLPSAMREPPLAAEVSALLAFGRGPAGVFERRLRDLSGGAAESPAERARRTAAIKATHERLLLTLTPLIDDAAFDLVLTTERVTEQSEAALTALIDIGAHILHLLLTVRSEANLAAG